MNNFYCSFVSIHYIICECGDTFPTEEGLQEHLDNEHKSLTFDRNEYQCSTCGKIFATEKACLMHQQVHNKRVKVKREPRDPTQPKKRYYTCKNIVCEVCGKRYASNAALRYHQRVHTGERPYQCSMCPKTFTMPLFLQIHVRTHTGERPYQCQMCPKAFSNKAALLRHDRVHSGIKPYECPQCGKFFTQSNSMKLHVKTVHLKMPAPYKSKNRRAKLALKQQAMASPVVVSVEAAAGESSQSMPVSELYGEEYRRVKEEPDDETQDEQQENDDEEYHMVQQEEEEEEEPTDQIKVEITEVPMYEDDVEQFEVVYEEVYEMEDQ